MENHIETALGDRPFQDCVIFEPADCDFVTRPLRPARLAPGPGSNEADGLRPKPAQALDEGSPDQTVCPGYEDTPSPPPGPMVIRQRHVERRCGDQAANSSNLAEWNSSSISS